MKTTPHSSLGNPMNRGAWWAQAQGVRAGHDLLIKPPLSKTSSCWHTPRVAHCYSLRRPLGVMPCRLLLLSYVSRVWLCVTPQTAAHQAPLSLGFSRQEHWSGLPFPSPMHESEKWKWSRSVVSDSSRPHGLQPSRLLRPWGFPGKSTRVGRRVLLWWHAGALVNKKPEASSSFS